MFTILRLALVVASLGILYVFSASGGQPEKKDQRRKVTQLAPVDSEMLRNIVYNGEIEIGTMKSKESVYRIVVIPERASHIFKRHPAATLALLQTITKGARPEDARKAGVLAMSLVKGPEAGVPIHQESTKEFDSVDEFGKTPRDRMVIWIEKLIQNSLATNK